MTEISRLANEIEITSAEGGRRVLFAFEALGPAAAAFLRSAAIALGTLSCPVQAQPRLIVSSFNSIFAARYPAWRILYEGPS